MQSLKCLACGSALSASALNRRYAVIFCCHCDAVFDLSNRGQGQQSPAAQRRASLGLSMPLEAELIDDDASVMESDTSQSPVSEASDYPLAQEYEYQESDTSIMLRRRWAAGGDTLGILFGLVFLSLPIIVLSVSPFDLFALLFLSLFVSVGALIVYRAISNIQNAIRIGFEDETLSVSYVPLWVPWKDQPKIAVTDIEQLYIRQHRREKSFSYSLEVVTRDGSKAVLFSALSSYEQAAWFEKTIESRLHLRDRRVAGEYLPDESKANASSLTE